MNNHNDNAEKLGSNLKSNIKKAAVDLSDDNIKQLLAKTVEDFGKYMSEQKDNITEKAEDYTEKYRDKIKDNPVAAVLTGVAVGALITVAICATKNK